MDALQKKLMALLSPFNAEGLQKKRLGRRHDGGYVVPINIARQARACLTYGVSDDISFELELVRACPDLRVFLFDHTIEAPPAHPASFRFFREGVTGRRNEVVRPWGGRARGVRMGGLGVWIERAPFRIRWNRLGTIPAHIRRLGLKGQPILLKIDVEGCEYDALRVVSDAVFSQVSMLIMEMHDLDEPETVTAAVQILSRIRRTLTLVHLHGNNRKPPVEAGDGLRYPQVVEAVFVNNRLIEGAVPAASGFPSALDQPCDPERPESDLSFIFAPAIQALGRDLD